MESGLLRPLLGLIAVAAVAEPVLAQESPPGRPVNEGWGLSLGAGTLVSPTYEGDNSSRVSILPSIQLSYGDEFFASVENGVGYRVINSPTLRAGPIGRIKFSRDEDGNGPFGVAGEDTDDLRGLGEVDTTFELGGFVEYDIGPITLGAEARKAVSGHDGAVLELDAKWSGTNFAFGPPIIWSAGPRLKIVDDTYTQAYFGVSASQSLASGLPQFQAGGGLYSYGVGATAIIPLDGDSTWTAVVFAGYDRLTGDAADNPLVQLRGSEDQASLGVFLSYRAF